MGDVINRRRNGSILKCYEPNSQGLATLVLDRLLSVALVMMIAMPGFVLAATLPASEFVVPDGPMITLQDGQVIDGHIVRQDQADIVIRATDGTELAVPRAAIDEVRFKTVTGMEVVGALIGWKPGVYELTTAEAVVTVYSTAPHLPLRDDDAETLAEVDATEPEGLLNPEILQSNVDANDNGGLSATLTNGTADTGNAAVTPQGGPVTRIEDQVAAVTPNSDLEIRVSTDNGRESGAAVSFNFELSRPSDKSVVLIYATLDDTAIDGEDYEAARGVLIIKAGQTEARIEARVINDDLSEEDEQLRLFLTVDPTVAMVKNREILATIEDDDQD